MQSNNTFIESPDCQKCGHPIIEHVGKHMELDEEKSETRLLCEVGKCHCMGTSKELTHRDSPGFIHSKRVGVEYEVSGGFSTNITDGGSAISGARIKTITKPTKVRKVI